MLQINFRNNICPLWIIFNQYFHEILCVRYAFFDVFASVMMHEMDIKLYPLMYFKIMLLRYNFGCFL